MRLIAESGRGCASANESALVGEKRSCANPQACQKETADIEPHPERLQREVHNLEDAGRDQSGVCSLKGTWNSFAAPYHPAPTKPSATVQLHGDLGHATRCK